MSHLYPHQQLRKKKLKKNKKLLKIEREWNYFYVTSSLITKMEDSPLLTCKKVIFTPIKITTLTSAVSGF